MLRKILKWAGIVLGGLIGLIVLALVVVLIYGQMSFHQSPRQSDVRAGHL